MELGLPQGQLLAPNQKSIHDIEAYPSLGYLQSLESELSRRNMHNTLQLFAKSLGYTDSSLPAHCYIDWTVVNEMLVRHFLKQLSDSGIGNNRVNTYLTAIKQCMHRAYKYDLVSKKQLMFVTDIKAKRVEKVQKGRVLESNDVINLLAPTGSTGWKRIRDNAIISILFACGLRRSELISLSNTSIIQKKQSSFFRVRGKGDKVRDVPIPPYTLARLQLWQSIRDRSSNNTHLFLAMRKGNRLTNNPIKSTTVIYDLIRDRCVEVGLLKCSPHDARRTMATLLYNEYDVSMEIIQELLGHDSIDTTRRYIFVNSDIFANAVSHFDY